jgi:hypothetical protein
MSFTHLSRHEHQALYGGSDLGGVTGKETARTLELSGPTQLAKRDLLRSGLLTPTRSVHPQDQADECDSGSDRGH